MYLLLISDDLPVNHSITHALPPLDSGSTSVLRYVMTQIYSWYCISRCTKEFYQCSQKEHLHVFTVAQTSSGLWMIKGALLSGESKSLIDNSCLLMLKHFHCSPIYVTLCLLYQLCFIVFKQFKMRKINNQNIATRSGRYPLDIDNSIVCFKSCFRVLPATDILHSGVGYEECIQLDNSRWMMKANDEFRMLLHIFQL